MDETINAFIYNLLYTYNERYNDNVKFDDINDYDISKFLKFECKNIFAEFCDNEFMSSLKLVHGAKDVIDRLHRFDDVYFVTAGYPETVLARHVWLSKHFKWYSSKNLIICNNKQMLMLDILIDDHYDNLVGGTYEPILIDKPWNKKYNVQTRVCSWFEIPPIINNFKKSERID